MKIYADTSVFGGVFDEEFARDSRQFFEDILAGKFSLVISALVEEEIEAAPEPVRNHFIRFASTSELAEISPAVLDLRDAYLSAGIVTSKSMDDATHVALATISQCEIIVSWNFKHIVHFQKIPKYNAVNILHGYRSINIYSPSEVISYDEF
jgi:predicted nucleic acid-binding protein